MAIKILYNLAVDIRLSVCFIQRGSCRAGLLVVVTDLHFMLTVQKVKTPSSIADITQISYRPVKDKGLFGEAVEQIRRVYEDNFGIIFVISP